MALLEDPVLLLLPPMDPAAQADGVAGESAPLTPSVPDIPHST